MATEAYSFRNTNQIHVHATCHNKCKNIQSVDFSTVHWSTNIDFVFVEFLHNQHTYLGE